MKGKGAWLENRNLAEFDRNCSPGRQNCRQGWPPRWVRAPVTGEIRPGADEDVQAFRRHGHRFQCRYFDRLLEENFGVLIARPDEIFHDFRNRNSKAESVRLISRLEKIKNRIGERLAESFVRSPASESSQLERVRFTKDQILQRNLLGSELSNDREVAFLARQFYSQMFWGIITGLEDKALLRVIGITLDPKVKRTIEPSPMNDLAKVWVHSVRMASRTGKRRQTESEYVVEVIQSRDGYFDTEIQALADAGKETALKLLWKEKYGDKPIRRDFRYRAGCTLLIDTRSFEIRRVIRTRFRADEDAGLDRMHRHLMQSSAVAPNAFDGPGVDAHKHDNVFAMLHRNVERGTSQWSE